MPPRNNAVNLGLRFSVQIFADGLVIQERDRVFRVGFGQRKQVPHGLDGNEYPGVRAIIPIASDFRHYAHDIKVDAIEQDR